MRTIRTNITYDFYRDVLVIDLDPTLGIEFHKNFYIKYISDATFREQSEGKLILIVNSNFIGVFKDEDEIKMQNINDDDEVFIIPIKQNNFTLLDWYITYKY
jgi:hypothetical protein